MYAARRILLFLLVALFFTTFSVLQAQTFDWVKKAGGIEPGEGGTIYSYNVACDKNNMLYVTGSFSRSVYFGTDSLVSRNGSDDIYVAKYDQDGVFQWAVSAGGIKYDEGNAVAADDLGNVYVTGDFTDSAVFGATTVYATGAIDIFLAKYNTNGMLQWVRTAGGNQNDAGWGLHVNRNGDVFVTGFFFGYLFFDYNILLADNIYSDVFIVKYDSTGKDIWAQKVGGESKDYAYGIVTDDSAGLYIAGSCMSTSVFGPDTLWNGYGYADIFLTKFDTAGNYLWVKRYGGSGDDVAYGVTSDHKGNVYLTGNFASPQVVFDNDTLNAIGTSGEMFVAGFTSSGTFRWVRQGGGGGDDVGTSVTTDTAGNVYMAGYFQGPASFDTIVLNGFANKDACVIKYDPDGKALWGLEAGGTLYDYGFGITHDNAGDVFVTGYYSGSVTFGSFAISAIAETDMFLSKITQGMVTVTSFETDAGDKHLLVYPNPTDGNITVSYKSSWKDGVLIRLTDIHGRIIFSRKEPETSALFFSEFNLGAQPAGIYFLEVIEGQKVTTKKVVYY